MSILSIYYFNAKKIKCKEVDAKKVLKISKKLFSSVADFLSILTEQNWH